MNKNLSNTMFRMYIEKNKSNKEQKFFEILFCFFLFGPVLFLIPFVITNNKVGMIVGLLLSWGIGLGYALIRKRRIYSKIFKIKIGEENIEKIQVSDMNIFDNIDRSRIFSIGITETDNSKFYNILYNWLNNIDVLKEGKLKMYCLTGDMFMAKYNVNNIPADSKIFFILFDDLNFTVGSMETFMYEHILFGRLLAEILENEKA